ncbi:MAG: thiamine pyrophosphate-binding protein [Gammaproteobacteria bacterium]|nr:thiamine pyrophosphate-binding protein [Gammaproteobacteria bacterium]
MKNGGQLIVEALEAQGVTRIFCVPGESYLPVLDALHDSPISTSVCRQEGGAAMMAEAWGKLAGSPGVCFVTRGPGATNAAAGVHVAAQDSTPMVLFVGQIDSACRHREAFQEVDYRQFFGDMVKWVAEIDSARRVPEMVSMAWHVATAGRPGPVVLVLPEDTLADQADVAPPALCAPAESHPGPAQIADLQNRLVQAQAPIIIAGGSRWNEAAVGQLQQFAERWQIPVECSFRRQALFDHTHPCYAGDVGLGINPDLRARLDQADLILMLGGRLSEIPSQDYTLLDIPNPRQSLIHVHPGAEELGKVYQPALGILSSPTAFMDAIKTLEPPAGLERETATAPETQHQSFLRWSGIDQAHEQAVMMRGVMNHLREVLPDDAVLTNGAGNYCTWIHRFWHFRKFGSQVAPTSGSMGYGLPAAIAAKLHAPDKTVVCFAGDGCIQMTGQEFGTAVQEQANIIVLVLDNSMYGTIRMHQERHFPGRISGTSLSNPDFAMIAKAYGAHGATVTEVEKFPAAMDAALAATRSGGTPALIHVHIDPQVITPSQVLA